MKLPARYAAGLAIAFITVPAQAIIRWNGDNLTNNNPPAQNVDLPAGVRNAIVRVKLQYQLRGGVLKTEVGSGAVIAATRNQQKNTGRLVILTGDHNTLEPTPPQFPRLTRWSVGFGNIADAGTQPYPVVIRRDGVHRPPANEARRRPDLAILVADIEGWTDVIPNDFTPIPVNEPVNGDIVQAGFGRFGEVDVTNRRYTVDMGKAETVYGVLRSGTNTVDAVEDHTTERSARTGETWEYKALRSDLDFRPAENPATSADSYFHDMDSGGPTLQVVNDAWRLVGVHSENEAADNRNRLAEGRRQWDVRAFEYRDWINQQVDPAPEPASALGLVLIALLARQRTRQA